LHAEQGLGDTIQFIRYAPLVKEQDAKVVVECQPALAELVHSAFGIDAIIPRGQALPPFDVYLPLLSLPSILRTSLATIPAKVPYLCAQPDRIQQWRVDARWPNAWKIGIAWRGNPQNTDDRYRSARLLDFEPLARLGVRMFSLQTGAAMDEVTAAPFPIVDLGSRFDPNSLDDLAAAIMNMDLVISIDTAVAHLAGALGQTVWTLLAASADWRWLLGREDSPWYPMMRLFRQAHLGQWQDVFARLAEEIQARNTLPGMASHSVCPAVD